ncbi:MAG: contractile injection system tape measure protein [Pyrinomonadaceae bacterium]
MLRLQHSIRKQMLEVEVSSEALALALQPRLGDINQKYLLPVIERVFDELDVQGQQIKISRLNINLGDLPFEHFEEVAAERFYHELRRALAKVLREQAENPTPDNRSQPEEASHLELLEHYLLYGTLPFWASHDAAFSFQELFSELAERDSARLIQSIKKHGHQRRVIERIVLQLGEARLRNLLGLLEPAHASLIIAYMIDLHETHRAKPLLSLGDNEFARFTWVLTLSYLIREHGSQFNRKSFVKSLLETMAASEGLEFSQVLTTLHLGLKETEKNRTTESSLPAVIIEIMRDINLETTTQQQQTEEASHLQMLEHCLLYGAPPVSTSRIEPFSLEEMMMELAERDSAALVRLIKKHGHQRRVVERIVMQLAEESLKRLLHLLEPAHAALIIIYMIDLREAQKIEPVLMLSDDEFSKLLWMLALSYLVKEHGSQFNRKSFVKSLLQAMADREGLENAQITGMIQLGLLKAEKSRPLESSLPAIISELVCELDEAELPEETEAQAVAQRAKHASSNSYVEDALARLELYLDETATSEAWKGGQETRGLLRFLAAHDALRARRIILQRARRSKHGLPVIADRLLQAFPHENLLSLLAPHRKESIFRLVEILSSIGARGAQINLASRIAPDSAVWKTLLEYLLSEPLAGWNLRGMIRQIVVTMAGRFGVSVASLAEMLASELEREAGAVEASLIEALNGVQQSLHEQPRATPYERSVFARYDQVEALSYYLRYGVLPWSALLRDHELTVADALRSLPGLSRSLLSALFLRERPDDQPRMLLRAVSMISEENLARLLLRLLPQAKDASSPFRSSLSAFASKAEDRQAFYATLIAAILDGRPLDLEELAASSQLSIAKPALALKPDEWEAHVLKSAIASRLRFGEKAYAGEHTLAALLQGLIASHTEDARHFCRALLSSHGMLSALIQQCDAPLFDSLFELLRPGESQILTALTQSLAMLSAPYSPSEENVRRALLYELLSLEEAEPLNSNFFIRVLRKLFGKPLPDEVRQSLLQKVVAWATDDRLTAAHVTAFRAAITADDDEPLPPHAKTSVVRDAVFTSLLGEEQKQQTHHEESNEDELSRLDLLSNDALRHTLAVMLEESPKDVYDFIVRQVSDSRRRERWIEVLPESALVRLSYLLEPRRHRALLDSTEVLASAWLEAVPQNNPALTERKVFWRFLLRFLSRRTEADHSVERLVADFFEYTSARYGAVSAEASDRADVCNGMLAHALRLASATGHARLHATLRSNRTGLLSLWEIPAPTERGATATDSKSMDKLMDDKRKQPRSSKVRGKMAFSMEAEPEKFEAREPLYIANAGLVLTAPFLPHLFQTLDMLHTDDDGRTGFRNQETISRAVHLLQYMVDGRTSAPEPLLVLNKILCGVATNAPIEREIVPTDKERESCERLLKSMIANWKIISNTSIAGLQETFLRREGRLERVDEGWRLRVQRKTVDVLVDQIPWSISIIYNRWMPQPLYTDW